MNGHLPRSRSLSNPHVRHSTLRLLRSGRDAARPSNIATGRPCRPCGLCIWPSLNRLHHTVTQTGS
jgi:hypothetical protein